MKVRRKSRLHAITIEDRGGVRTMQFDDVVQSSMRLDGSADEGLEYADFFHLVTLLRGTPRQALLIGLGGGTVPKQLLLDYPELVLDVAEIDAAVIELAREHFGFETSERCRVHEADGADFVKRARQQWDLIMLDAYTIEEGELSVPAPLVTREFFEQCAARLTRDGVLAFNCAASPANALTRGIRAAIAGVFGHGLVFESGNSDNSVVLASRTAIEKRPDRLAQLARRSVHAGMVERRSLLRRCRQLVESW
jgi:spermidine synthase